MLILIFFCFNFFTILKWPIAIIWIFITKISLKEKTSIIKFRNLKKCCKILELLIDARFIGQFVHSWRSRYETHIALNIIIKYLRLIEIIVAIATKMARFMWTTKN